MYFKKRLSDMAGGEVFVCFFDDDVTIETLNKEGRAELRAILDKADGVA